jgi:serine/threonine-protein kinase ULK2
MSPQVLNREPYSEKADIWSLGVVFYEMLFGRLPYYGANFDSLLGQMKDKPDLHSKTPISPDADDFIQRCLEIKESKRASWR